MKPNRLLWGVLSAGAVLALVASACGPGAGSQNAAPKPITITFVQEPDSLNPLYTTMFFSGITRDLWLTGLWNFNENNQPVPQMAAEIPSESNGGITNGGRTLTVRLNPLAVWSDGQPVTAADVVFSYDMIISDANAAATRYPYKDYITSVTASDEHTAVVEFSQPFAPWQTLLFTSNSIPVLPKHILEPIFLRDGTLDKAEWNKAPTVGAGPYTFVEWKPGDSLRFERNPKWWGPQPKIDSVTIRIVTDEQQLQALTAGDSDIGVFLDYSQVADINASGKATVTPLLSGYDEGWYFNLAPALGHPALQDVNVRRALVLAVDREKLIQDNLLGLTVPASTFWDGTPPYGDPGIKPYAYDPAQAARLLNTAGWVDNNGDGIREKDGVSLKLRYLTNQRQLRKDVQASVQAQWRAVGVDSELINVDDLFASFADGGLAATGQYDVAEWSDIGAFPDPDSSKWLCSDIPTAANPDGQNWQFYCNDTLDGLFKEQATAVDPQTRLEIFFRIERFMYDNVIWAGLWRDPDLWSVSRRLTGVQLSGTTPLAGIAAWDVAQ